MRPLPDSMPPQVGAGGGTPSPRNDSAELGQDHDADARREQHDDGRQHVGQDVPPQDAQRGGADRLRGMHVHVLAHRDDGAADDARAGDAEQQARA